MTYNSSCDIKIKDKEQFFEGSLNSTKVLINFVEFITQEYFNIKDIEIATHRLEKILTKTLGFKNVSQKNSTTKTYVFNGQEDKLITEVLDLQDIMKNDMKKQANLYGVTLNKKQMQSLHAYAELILIQKDKSIDPNMEDLKNRLKKQEKTTQEENTL